MSVYARLFNTFCFLQKLPQRKNFHTSLQSLGADHGNDSVKNSKDIVQWLHSSETDDLSVEKRNQVLYLKYNRPTKYNALSVQMYNKLIKSLRDVNHDDSIKAIVLTGIGDYYSSGNDLNNFLMAAQHPDGLNAGLRFSTKIVIDFVDSLINLEKFIIAAINGPAIGVTVTTLPLFDYIVASDKATFQTPFSTLGMCPEACSSYTFPKIMGQTRASEMLLMNRKISAIQAKEFGLISDVTEHEKLDEFVQNMLHGKHGLIETCYPNSLKVGKSLIRSTEIKKKLSEVNVKEAEELYNCWIGDECKNAIQKFMRRSSKE